MKLPFKELMRSKAVVAGPKWACKHTPGHNTSKWTTAAQVANWESGNQGAQQTLHLLCIIDLDFNANTHKHIHAQRGREKQRERGREKADTLHGAVRHHISTHWPPFYLLWSLSVLSFYQLEAGGDWGTCVRGFGFRNTLTHQPLFGKNGSGSLIPANKERMSATTTGLFWHNHYHPRVQDSIHMYIIYLLFYSYCHTETQE